jgi:hypothetical protein
MTEWNWDDAKEVWQEEAREEVLNAKGEIGKAAQICDFLDFDGTSDWFLPSKNELDLMYKNLCSKGLGEFAGRNYWSSSTVQHNNADAWFQTFYVDDGDQDFYSRIYPYYVRAVRAF